MTPQERELIRSLFERIRAAEGGPKDPEAERLIAEETAANPAAAYYMAQAILVQEQALTAADQRIRQLEAEAKRAPGPQNEPQKSFLAGSPWGPRPGQAAQPDAPQQPPSGGYAPPPAPGYGDAPGFGPAQAGPGQGGPAQGGPARGGFMQGGSAFGGGGGPSFLSGALSTAAGVAGGALLFQGISSLFGHHGFGGSTLGSGLGNVAGTPGETVINETTINEYGRDSQGADDAWRRDPGPEPAGQTDNAGQTDDAGWNQGGGYQDASWSDDDGSWDAGDADSGWDDSDSI